MPIVQNIELCKRTPMLPVKRCVAKRNQWAVFLLILAALGIGACACSKEIDASPHAENVGGVLARTPNKAADDLPTLEELLRAGVSLDDIAAHRTLLRCKGTIDWIENSIRQFSLVVVVTLPDGSGWNNSLACYWEPSTDEQYRGRKNGQRIEVRARFEKGSSRLWSEGKREWLALNDCSIVD